MTTPMVSFSELSKNAEPVAETLKQVEPVHVVRRDGEDPYLTTARHDLRRTETADVTARILTALMPSDDGERAPAAGRGPRRGDRSVSPERGDEVRASARPRQP